MNDVVVIDATNASCTVFIYNMMKSQTGSFVLRAAESQSTPKNPEKHGSVFSFNAAFIHFTQLYRKFQA